MVGLSRPFCYLRRLFRCVLNPGMKPVWALSLSLAATQEIDVSFSSSGYLDVSVPLVSPHTPMDSVYDA